MADDADQAAAEQAQTPEELAVAQRIDALERENKRLREASKPKDPNQAPEPEPAKVGAVCNHCDGDGSDSRQAPADPDTGEVPDRDDDTEFGLRDVLSALNHNAVWGHTVTLHDGDGTFQLSPRPA